MGTGGRSSHEEQRCRLANHSSWRELRCQFSPSLLAKMDWPALEWVLIYIFRMDGLNTTDWAESSVQLEVASEIMFGLLHINKSILCNSSRRKCPFLLWGHDPRDEREISSICQLSCLSRNACWVQRSFGGQRCYAAATALDVKSYFLVLALRSRWLLAFTDGTAGNQKLPLSTIEVIQGQIFWWIENP